MDPNGSGLQPLAAPRAGFPGMQRQMRQECGTKGTISNQTIPEKEKVKEMPGWKMLAAMLAAMLEVLATLVSNIARSCVRFGELLVSSCSFHGLCSGSFTWLGRYRKVHKEQGRIFYHQSGQSITEIIKHENLVVAS